MPLFVDTDIKFTRGHQWDGEFFCIISPEENPRGYILKTESEIEINIPAPVLFVLREPQKVIDQTEVDILCMRFHSVNDVVPSRISHYTPRSLTLRKGTSYYKCLVSDRMSQSMKFGHHIFVLIHRSRFGQK